MPPSSAPTAPGTSSPSDIRQKLVEVAARHFAEHGFHGASQRAIQREMGVNNSTVNYHFGSKEALYRAVVDEAVSRIQATRLSGLKGISADLSAADRLRALLTAYLGAHLHEATSEAGYNYVRIVASLNLVVPDIAATILDEKIAPVRDLYVDDFAKLFPGASRNRIQRVLRLTVGLMAMAPVQVGRKQLSEAEIARITADVIAIAVIAFQQLCPPDEADD